MTRKAGWFWSLSTVIVVGDWQDAGPIERSFTQPYVVQQVQSVLTAQ